MAVNPKDMQAYLGDDEEELPGAEEAAGGDDAAPIEERFPTLLGLLAQHGAELEELIDPLDHEELADPDSELTGGLEGLVGIVSALPEDLVVALVTEPPQDFEDAQEIADALEEQGAIVDADAMAGFLWHASIVAESMAEGNEEEPVHEDQDRELIEEMMEGE